MFWSRRGRNIVQHRPGNSLQASGEPLSHERAGTEEESLSDRLRDSRRAPDLRVRGDAEQGRSAVDRLAVLESVLLGLAYARQWARASRQSLLVRARPANDAAWLLDSREGSRGRSRLEWKTRRPTAFGSCISFFSYPVHDWLVRRISTEIKSFNGDQVPMTTRRRRSVPTCAYCDEGSGRRRSEPKLCMSIAVAFAEGRSRPGPAAERRVADVAQ